jgi:hypothetical protein
MKAALWLATLILLICSRPLLACSCAPQTTQQLFQQSAIVFLATTTNVDFIDQDAPSIEPRIKVQFADAEKSWKGKALKRLQTVFNKFSCSGFAFEASKKYLVFVYKEAGENKVGVCTVFVDPAAIAAKTADLNALVP